MFVLELVTLLTSPGIHYLAVYGIKLDRSIKGFLTCSVPTSELSLYPFHLGPNSKFDIITPGSQIPDMGSRACTFDLSFKAISVVELYTLSKNYEDHKVKTPSKNVSGCVGKVRSARMFSAN